MELFVFFVFSSFQFNSSVRRKVEQRSLERIKTFVLSDEKGDSNNKVGFWHFEIITGW